MKKEDVARIGFAPGRAPQQQRQFSIGLRMGGEIVVDHERVVALPHPLFGQPHPANGARYLSPGNVVASAATMAVYSMAP